MGYLGNFIVYALAMVGVIAVSLLIFKNATCGTINKNSKNLKVVDTISLAPRKVLYIVSAGQEKFLIAGDVDRTTLISKLEDKKILAAEPTSFKETMEQLPKPINYMDKSNIGIKSSLLDSSKKNNGISVMKSLADRISK